MKTQDKKMTLSSLILFVLSMIFISPSWAQNEKQVLNDENRYSSLEAFLDNTPHFSYECKTTDDHINQVIIPESGASKSNSYSIVFIDLNNEKNKLSDHPDAHSAVFYTVDEDATYKKGGLEAFSKKLMGELSYPDKAEEWGVEGTIFVKFIINDEGEIPYITTSHDSESSFDNIVANLEKEAISAVKATSGEWTPATVDDSPVPTLAVVPIIFEHETPPFLPGYIY